jgi:hypothetical protein
MDASSHPDREFEELPTGRAILFWVGGFPIEGMDASSRPDREFEENIPPEGCF